MEINANTRLSVILKAHPDALEKIVSINKKFEKLRNPILRKLMAPRTSISMAAKIGDRKPGDFFEALAPLGFTFKDVIVDENDKSSGFVVPTDTSILEVFDVRPILDSGNDPLKAIVDRVNKLPQGKYLKIINTFEPTPLILLLEKKGFEANTVFVNDNLTETYFYKKENIEIKTDIENTEDWEVVLAKFKDNLVSIDVRHLEMPLPMTTILETLETLENGKALYVNHKKIPVFLLSELKERDYNYLIKEEGTNDVKLIIYKK